MWISVLFAKLIGTYCMIIAIGIMFNFKAYQKVMEDFSKNAALVYVGGIIALIFGLLIVLFHNLWIAKWAVIITIVGWLGIIKGIWLIVLPNTVAKLTGLYQRNSTLLRVHLVIVFAIGAFLAVRGYFIR